MSIYRIGSFQARADLLQEMQDFLYSIMPLIKSSEGCEAVQLFQNEEDPTKFTMIEIWDGLESHRESVKHIPTEKLAEIGPLLATAPSGNYYSLLREISA